MDLGYCNRLQAKYHRCSQLLRGLKPGSLYHPNTIVVLTERNNSIHTFLNYRLEYVATAP